MSSLLKDDKPVKSPNPPVVPIQTQPNQLRKLSPKPYSVGFALNKEPDAFNDGQLVDN